eukprot:871203-Rhodomonas_salina.1
MPVSGCRLVRVEQNACIIAERADEGERRTEQRREKIEAIVLCTGFKPRLDFVSAKLLDGA